MPIKCFDLIGNDKLTDAFNKAKGDKELSEYDEKILATKVALDFHKDIVVRLNDIKSKTGGKVIKLNQKEVLKKIDALKQEFDKKQAEEKTLSHEGLMRAEAKKIHARVAAMEAPTNDARQIALRYLADGGTVSESAINEVAGTVKRARLNTGAKELKSNEAKARDYYKKEGDTLDELSHMLWQRSGQKVSERDIKDALMEVISNNNTRLEASKAYLEQYNLEYREEEHYARLAEERAEEFDKELKDIENWLQDEGEKTHPIEAEEEHINNLIKQYEAEFKAENQQPTTTSEGEAIEKTSSRTSGKENETKEVEPPTPPTETEVSGESEESGIGITHSDTEKLREKHGLGEYQRVPETVEQWDAEAEKRMKEGKMPKLIKALENGYDIKDPVERRMLGKHIANLNEAVEKNPTNENIAELQRVTELSDKSNSNWGKIGVATKGTFLPDDTLGSKLIEEAKAIGIPISELTEADKQKVIAEHKEMSEIKEQLIKAEAKIKEMEAEAAAKEALLKIRNESKAKGTRKTKEDFVKERASLKDELKAAKEKHEQWLKDNGISKAGASPFVLTTDMAKVIAKIVKSHAEETALKFEDLVNNVYEEVKDVLDGISKKDIVNVMSGAYNEKKETLESAKSKISDYTKEAKLLQKLEDERKGGVEKLPSEKRNQKSRRIKELEDKIKEIRDRNNDKEPIEKTTAERLAAKRKAILKKIDELNQDVKDGKFEKEKQKQPLILDKKTQMLQDRLIELEAQQANRRAKAEYEKMSGFQKGMDTVHQVLGIRRFINAAIDFSVMFRQARDVTMNPFKYVRIENGKITKGTAAKAWVNMFNLAFDTKAFKRFQYDLEKSDIGREFMHFGGVFSNPTEVKMLDREEAFTNNIFSRINQKIQVGDNEKLKKAADVVDKIWFSERAAAAALNTMRIEEFERGVSYLKGKGITMENNPKEYKDLVKWVMNITGRGNLIGFLEDSHKGRLLANRTYFGARLMAAKINMLNPATYAQMNAATRKKALLDMAGATSGFMMLGAAAMAAGATVSLDYDDSDFLQARFGDNVYDLTGGSVAYIRTFLRFMTAVAKQVKNPNSKAANSYSKFAGSSMVKSLLVNKLAPNTAYALHAYTGKSAEYDERGRLKPFDPYEFLKIYPLYVDNTVDAFKKGGMSEAATILIPDLFGIGTAQYKDKAPRKTNESSNIILKKP